MLRSLKNRFGDTDEVAVLDMTSRGLEAVADPSQALMQGREDLWEGAAREGDRGRGLGSVVTVALAGRPLLVEIQALATDVLEQGMPRHTFAQGVDQRRVFIVLQVLQKFARVHASGKDVTVSAVGGLDLRGDPSMDLALAVAVASSVHDRPAPRDVAVVGELGLAGEVRPVAGVARRVAEASRLGLKRIIVPAAGWRDRDAEGLPIEVMPVRTLKAALRAVLSGGGGTGGGGGR